LVSQYSQNSFNSSIPANDLSGKDLTAQPNSFNASVPTKAPEAISAQPSPPASGQANESN